VPHVRVPLKVNALVAIPECSSLAVVKKVMSASVTVSQWVYSIMQPITSVLDVILHVGNALVLRMRIALSVPKDSSKSISIHVIQSASQKTLTSSTMEQLAKVELKYLIGL
jgi:hypothetical protein